MRVPSRRHRSQRGHRGGNALHAPAFHASGDPLKRPETLIYDAANPYFAACGDWPGWPGVLSAALDDANHHDLRFRAVSWQELMPLLVLDDAARDWAREKHGLATSG